MKVGDKISCDNRFKVPNEKLSCEKMEKKERRRRKKTKSKIDRHLYVFCSVQSHNHLKWKKRGNEKKTKNEKKIEKHMGNI